MIGVGDSLAQVNADLPPWADVRAVGLLRLFEGAAVVKWWERGIFLFAYGILLFAASLLAIPGISFADDHCLIESLPRRAEKFQSEHPTSAPLLLASGNVRILRLVVVASGDYTAGRSDTDVFENILQSLEVANGYLRDARIKLELAGVQSYQPGVGDPYADAARKRDARQMLEIVRLDWNRRTFPDHDLVAVFGKSTFGGTFGLAYPGTVCVDKRFAFLFVSQGGEGPIAELSFGATLAHEIGHSLGMSHDDNFYSDGPSVMWPFFSANVNRLSPKSLKELADFEAIGGTACLEQTNDVAVVSGTDSSHLSFTETPYTVELDEGNRYLKSFPLAETFPGVTFGVSGLPPGASFDGSTGTIDYTPGYDTATRSRKRKRFDLLVRAQTFGALAELPVRIIVRDVNRAPTIAHPGTVSAEAGTLLRFTVPSQDLDSGDRSSLSLLNKNQVKGYPGSPSVRSRGSDARVEWQLPANLVGDFSLSFGARDRSGAQSFLNVVVSVTSVSSGPAISGPDEILAQAGQTSAAVVMFGAGASSLSLNGLPQGLLVTQDGSELQLQYFRSSSASNETFKIELEVNSPSGKSVKTVSVNVPKGDQGMGVTWPGKAQAPKARRDIDGDGLDEVSFYQRGTWVAESCDGSVTAARFGGLPGDIPLLFRDSGVASRAIYRIENGLGVWHIDRPGKTSLSWGTARDIPVPADLNGDGSDEVIVYRARSDEWLTPGAAATVYTRMTAAEGERVVPFAGDVDGDGTDELIRFYRTADGELRFESSLLDGKKLLAVLGRASAGQSALPFVEDVDGDGRTDFGVQTSGEATYWFLSASGAVVSGPALVPAGSGFAAQHCDTSGTKIAVYDSLFGKTVETKLGAGSFMLSERLGLTGGSRRSVDSLNLAARFGLSVLAGADVDRDGRANLAVYREDIRSSAGQWITESAGAILALPEVPAIFSHQLSGRFFSLAGPGLTSFGDGWWFNQPLSGEVTIEQWGQFGDVPVPADYNGDGIVEYAIFRPNDSTWWILYKSNNGDRATSVTWGQRTDIPVPGDYDGDGAFEVAVFRPSSGSWFIRYADGRVETKVFGAAGDVPVQGSYVSPGVTEPSVYRTGTREWIVRTAAGKENELTTQWGTADDLPVTLDRDGDGVLELTVFRPGIGFWFTLPLSPASAPNGVQFGFPGDSPIGAKNTLRIF